MGMDGIKIRAATTADAASILEIYRYYVENTAISFEYETPDIDAFRLRMARTLEKYPYLAAVRAGEILGYAYGGPFVGRAAYDWSAELTIYVAADQRKHGIGRMLYSALERRLGEMGILNLYACVGYPAEEDPYLTKNSVQFHEHLGFRRVGTFHNCGCKFQRWYDMVWMEKIIGVHGENQAAVRRWPEIADGA